MNRLRIIFYVLCGLLGFGLMACSKKKPAAPQLKLEGKEVITLTKGAEYQDSGAKAVDATGEDLVVKQFGNVDTSRVGSYGITYICEDHLGQRSVAARRVMVIGKNLLADKNPQVFKAGIEQFDAKAYVYDQDSHRADGSGSLKLQAQGKAAFGKSVISPVFRLEKGHHYTIRAYIKMTGDARGQNLLMKVSKKDDYKVFQEVYWNIAEMDKWEQVILPYRAAVSGEYNFRFFLHKHSYNTDDKVVTKEAKNLAKNPIIYFDDFSVVESVEALSSEPITAKLPFESSSIRVDEQGNWSVKEEGAWKAIFPKFTYRDWMGDFDESARRFKEYGFTGIVNIDNMDHLKKALHHGLKYNGIQVNELSQATKDFILQMRATMDNEELSPTAVITYNHDNESVFMGGHYQQKRETADWLDHHDQDAQTHRRGRPIFVLNGVAEGLARNLNNRASKVMDVTGSYVSQHGEATDTRYQPVSTLAILRNSHRQQAPVSIMAVQSYYHATFIPMLFKGIADGAKGLKFWRGGTTHNGSKKDFRENSWAAAIKGEDGVFARIDKMLPIIRQPLGVDWSATIPWQQTQTISMGLRDRGNQHYLIMANFSDQDQLVKVSLGGIYVTEARDYFTGEVLSTIDEGKFEFTLGHFNDGYKVIELK